MLKPILGAAAIVLAVAQPALADQPETAEAAMRTAERIADCPGCEFYFGTRPQESARRGLADIGIEAPEGGGYHILLAYTGTRWARLWEGNGSTQNLFRLPAKTVICMDPGGWTNIRNGPGLNYRRVGKVARPTVKKVFEARLTKPLGKTDGEAWWRISYNGRPAWVQNLRTIEFGSYGSTATKSCKLWKQYYG